MAQITASLASSLKKGMRVQSIEHKHRGDAVQNQYRGPPRVGYWERKGASELEDMLHDVGLCKLVSDALL